MIVLTDPEVRVLGCLLEKEMTTPDYYPLSLNALVNAANQKSNREPVVAYDEKTVVRALEELKVKQLAWQSDSSRVPKYAHGVDKVFTLVRSEAAILCLLMLRGPQTIGELRGRSERMYEFKDLDEVAEGLESLEEAGLVKKMVRQPGRKESRFAQLLAGEPKDAAPPIIAQPEAATLVVRAENERLAYLEKEVERQRAELDELRQAFLDFKSQFD
jgi:uncharacterized protein YceH (UPF0502 family)